MKRVFARFNNQGICVGRVITSDPSLLHDPLKEGYIEIHNPLEQQLVENNECKRIVDATGKQKIVLL